MTVRKILLFILWLIAYCMYSVHMWFMKDNGEANAAEISQPAKEIQAGGFAVKSIEKIQQNVKTKVIPLFIKDACSVLEIFTVKLPAVKSKVKKMEGMATHNNALSMFGIAVFLVILTVNAILDAIKVKEEEKVKRQLNPTGERRQSLAEFANKKTSLRRESSKFGQQLFQIAESFVSKEEEKKPRRQAKPYTRGDSTNSYLSENTRKSQSEGSAPASISETASVEPRLVKRQSVAKLIGGRPAPMVRRSSFPVLPQNPDIQALMLGHRQQSVDSDDEDGRGRRVRIIRRY